MRGRSSPKATLPIRRPAPSSTGRSARRSSVERGPRSACFGSPIKACPWTIPSGPLVRKHVEVLAGRAPFLQLHVAQALPTGTAVLRDGVLVDPGSLEKRQPIDPGPHIVEIRVPGHQDRRYEVLLSEGRTLDLTLEPELCFRVRLRPARPRSARRPITVSWDGSSRAEGSRLSAWGRLPACSSWNNWDTVTSHCNVDTKVCTDDAGVEADRSGSHPRNREHRRLHRGRRGPRRRRLPRFLASRPVRDATAFTDGRPWNDGLHLRGGF